MKRIVRGTDLRPNAARDVGDELRFHLEMRTREFIEAGMTSGDACRAAAAAFGDLTAIDAELRIARSARITARDRRDRVHDLLMDVSFALRTLRQNLSFTVAALGTLALGIGATTTVFAVVNGVLLRPLPYADPSRLAMIWLSSKSINAGAALPLSAGIFAQAQTDSGVFAGIASFRSWPYTISSGGDAEQLAGARVTPSLFPVLGVRPVLGRGFVDADAEPGAASVAVISDALWQRRFGASASAVGSRVELGGSSFTIVGVMPPGFAFPRGAELLSGLQFGARTEVWTPLSLTPADRRDLGTLNLAAIARLKPGVSAAAAQRVVSSGLRAFLTVNAPKLKLEYRLVGLQQQAGEHVRRGLLLLMGAVLCVLFIACANVTNLLVARTAARRREFAVRAALGAGRARIARQLVTENVILAALGTALGVALSAWATRLLLRLVPGSMPRVDDIGLDWRIALAIGALAILLGAGFGLVSALQVRWSQLAAALHDASARSTGGRARGVGRRLLVVAEVSLSLILVIGAALLTLSFVRIQRVEPGFVPSGVLTASVVLPISGGFDPVHDGPRWARFFSQLVDNVAKSPGVKSAGAVSALPLTGTAESGAFAIVGEPKPDAGQAPQTEYAVVQGAYFGAMGVKIAAGRAFDATDLATSTPVVVVNRELTRKYFAGASPLGKQMVVYFDFSHGTPRTIVGVVDNVQSSTLDTPINPQVYLPEQQMSYPGMRIVVRTAGDPMAALGVLKREVTALDPRLALADVRRIEDVFDDSLAREKFSMAIVALFAASALALAVVGLYGVIALSVGQRRREIGVRMALGARPLDVLRLVVGEGARITLAGIVIGLIGAFALSRLIAALLFGVSSTSTSVYAAATVAIAAVTLVATYLPARRAMRVDPTAALKE